MHSKQTEPILQNMIGKKKNIQKREMQWCMCEHHQHFMDQFEQAFDTVEWPFVGQAWVKWINYFYTDILSAHLLHVVLPESVR